MISFRNLLFSTVAVLLAVALAAASEPEVEVFQLGYVNAQEMETTVRALLSSSGKVTVNSRTNSLVVVDSPEVLRLVKKTLARLDAKPVNINIEVTFVEKSAFEKLSLKIAWRMAGDGWMIGSIPPPAGGGPLAVDALLTISTSESQKKQSILVMENKPGRIFVGSEHPYTSTGIVVQRRGAYVTQNTEFKSVGTSLQVTASRTGDGRLAVSVEPESSQMEAGGVVSAKRASTSVALDDPGTMVISRTDDDSSSSGINIPAGGEKSASTRSFVMILKVHSER